MRIARLQFLLIAAAALGLAGCNTTAGTSSLFGTGGTTAQAEAPMDGTKALGYGPPAATGAGLHGNDPNNPLSLGKQQYRTGNYGLAERHFRRAVETHPRDAEAWLGLAAAYDRLRRFDLADKAYEQAIRIVGATPEILNNQGFSYMLRGDYARARARLADAQRIDPGNKFVANNLALLAESSRQGKAVQ